jgi:outer membrane receptor protein involved in Fe transport
VQTDFILGRFQRPLIPRDRAFLNLAYATKNNWKFDFTIQRVGKQRIPFTFSNPVEYQLPEYSDPYWLANGQVSKDFKERWSVYVGLENITNFRLDNPIVAAADPFGMYFDSSMVWGPVFGRMWYAGFRYRVAK